MSDADLLNEREKLLATVAVKPLADLAAILPPLEYAIRTTVELLSMAVSGDVAAVRALVKRETEGMHKAKDAIAALNALDTAQLAFAAVTPLIEKILKGVQSE